MNKTNEAIKLAFEKGYYVNDKSEVFYKGNPRKLKYDRSGYARLTIRFNKKSVSIPVHKLQAYSKFGDIIFTSGITVRHLDNNSQNNNYDNISYGTQSENYMDIPKEIRIARAKHASSFVTKYDAEKIKKDHNLGLSYKSLMKKYNISSKASISYIVNYR